MSDRTAPRVPFPRVSLPRVLLGLGASLVGLAVGVGGVSAVAPLARVHLLAPPAPLKAGSSVPLVVQNDIGLPKRVRRGVTVERWTGRGWVPLSPPVALYLRPDCKPDPKSKVLVPTDLGEQCLVVPPRGRFASQPWLGTLGDAQCACERCVPAPAGLYRFRGRACDGPEVLLSPPFTLR
ncbi:MAG: hypothetical protein IT371_28245 [Deltaproteobacteria bacterium]|nr:hypothetical protein [Deltaproteobacteria bacterium]